MAQHVLPEISVLCINEADIKALNQALSATWPAHTQSLKIGTIYESLRNLPKENQFDLIVSPANSYGILDGGFDDAISRTFCLPKHHYRALTDAAQRKLYEQWRGFAPPGSCTLVKMPSELQETNRWGCRHVALCPTMRVPSIATWNREVVYESVWSLMCEVDRWNYPTGGDSRAEDRISTILTTPLATGTGGVDSDTWACQFTLALKHFSDALERPQRWSSLEWTDLNKEVKDVEATWE
ncbi:uncharacterized protein TRUGW13939_04727 [Talaromyces rugulosus]|uniref:Macro domain-like protein n=1 Tax=Talaromyces rugulosus TaxID=121627 RepID=A0A7H8QUG4_TALRU|nr:uncharacterized protein TRUGW13939_04727 [Talaromyces rugulosus]QKX57609.1 hypothetical protein TRUGW13939_04727 [Talaromyces rugulosus]